jgi:hypothetical protein
MVMGDVVDADCLLRLGCKSQGKPALRWLCEDFFDDVAVDVGEAEVAALGTVGELGVIEA